MDSKAFDHKRIAEGYAKDRPFLHENVMRKLKADLNAAHNFPNGLDVGCGAGLSTKALKMVCDQVTGIDISEEMVSAAKALYPESSYTFIQCPAEEAEKVGGGFDLVSAAGVVNWVDEARFLTGLQRILKPDGTVVIYDFWISDRMKGTPDYTDWWNGQYLRRFPRPPRKENVWTDADVAPYGFAIWKQTLYTMECEMDREAFVRFMLLQSNVSARVEGQGWALDEISAWFMQSLEPIFRGEKRTLIFEGYSWYLKKK